MYENKSEKSFGQLGLPPMELAETNRSELHSVSVKKCAYPFVQKSIAILTLILLTTGSYVVFQSALKNLDNNHDTEIIIVTGISSPNKTLLQSNVGIFVEVKNNTTYNNSKRIKRETITHDIKNYVENLDDNKIKQAREIIKNHNVSCTKENKNDLCKDLVTKLQSITENNELSYLNESTDINVFWNSNHNENNDVADQIKTGQNNDFVDFVTSTDKFKRETKPVHMEHVRSTPYSLPFDNRDTVGYGNGNTRGHLGPIYPQQISAPQLTDTCLLARLLKENQAASQGSYDNPTVPYFPNYNNYHSRHGPMAVPPPYLRQISPLKHQMHSQDIDIITKFLPPRTTHRPTNSTTREAECILGSMACDNGECIDETRWCDAKVDCSDISDESRCSCRSRVDKSRHCDGYFDCPFGEDEMGCYGCTESSFSCEDLDINSMSTCFTKEQRCDNTPDCPNHKDEIDCTMLAPSLHTKPLFAVSNTEGFLQRNYKGNWYAVCENPYMWAHDACRRETGLIIRPPFIEVVQIDPTVKVDYLNTGPGGWLHTSNTCFNSSAIYVTCPDLLCGTRVMTTTQILRENAAIENHLFGRNKRFLVSGHPYPLTFFSNRKKRQTENMKNSFVEVNKADSNVKNNKLRNKRTNSRVVGGRPSRPAAWPWVVAMYRDGMFHCGGVILNQDWVLSAAHCVYKFWQHYYEIQVGMLRRFSFSPQEQNHLVMHIIVNQKYNQEDMKNDVSLLKVKPGIQFSRWVRPICLPGPETAGMNWLWGPAPKTMCTAVGWGATIEHGPDPDHLREVEVPIWEQCKYREDKAGREICAGEEEGGKDACQGDSGGPLLCRNPLNSQQWYMAGIVSHGDGCARKDEPGVYTRVSLFVKWIRYHILSKTLPVIQPKQECPGFKCMSGIPKCIPLKRMCDKIIDCLNGEDEIHCNPTRTTSLFDNIFLTTPSKESSFLTKENRTYKEANIETSGSKDQLRNIDNFKARNIEDLVDSKAIIIDRNKESESNISMEVASTDFKSNINTEPDFTLASTLEIPNRSTETSESNSEEDTTTIRISTQVSEDIGKTDRGDMQIITSVSRESIESFSSILENQQLRVSDITDDWTDTVVTLLPHTQSSTKNLTMNSADSTTEKITKTIDEHSTGLVNISTHSVLQEKKNITHFTIPITNNNSTPESKELESEIISEGSHSSLAPHSTKDLQVHSIVEESSAKFLSDAENSKELFEKIKDIVHSTLEPAKRQKHHVVPKIFECRRINQIVPYHQRCDRKADCEDGTDETECSCSDYLSRFEENLLCDGIFDCADGQDEIDCYSCSEGQFLCKRSQLCLASKYVCDGKPQCPLGEDELDCFALSNGNSMVFDLDGRPKINLEGFLTKKHVTDWHIVCEDNLTTEQQELAATHICRYLGFSSANRYFVKHINIKEEELLHSKMDDKRKRRGTEVPIYFAYRKVEEDTARHILIKEPHVLKEHCVPNITKTCMSLYVYCDHSLYTDFDISNELAYKQTTDSLSYMWPWIAKVYVDGIYKCSGVLVSLSYTLVSHSCLWDTVFSQRHVSVSVGSHRTLESSNGLYEQVRKVDRKKDLYTSKVTLLHMKQPVEYSSMVKPMIISLPNMQEEKVSMCVAIGQDGSNNTVNVFVSETKENCDLHSRCYKKVVKDSICTPETISNQAWAGIISCHTEQGWYPAASFVDSRGECGLEDKIIGSNIRNLKNELKHNVMEKSVATNTIEPSDNCDGVRCGRGKCVQLADVCDGVDHCEDEQDESEEACETKHHVCNNNPFYRGCECSSSELKCHNGKCIPKELFNNGRDDCGDGSDEPEQMSCSRYLARVQPSRLCDGILHCKDRSDEDPMFCKCFAKRTYKCHKSSTDMEFCVAPDMVCDGKPDCPNAEDESTCIGLSAPEGTTYGSGQVIVRSHGVWHSKCYDTQNHTKSELESICRELGFIGGHAKKLMPPANLPSTLHNTVILDTFSEVFLNNNTRIQIRNSEKPVATPTMDKSLKNCFTVFIECL